MRLKRWRTIRDTLWCYVYSGIKFTQLVMKEQVKDSETYLHLLHFASMNPRINSQPQSLSKPIFARVNRGFPRTRNFPGFRFYACIKGHLEPTHLKSSPLFTFSTKSLGQDSPSIHLFSKMTGSRLGDCFFWVKIHSQSKRIIKK